MPDYSELFQATGGARWHVFVDGVLFTDNDGQTYSTTQAGAQERAVGAFSENPDATEIELRTNQVVRMNIGLMRSLAGAMSSSTPPLDPSPDQIVVDTISLADGEVGSIYYADALLASGGNGSYTWSIVSGFGTLPPGLSLSGASIVGTPSGSAGSFGFRVRASDGVNTAGVKDLVINITDAVTDVTIIDTDIPQATVGQAYSHQFTATGGDGGYVWSWDGEHAVPAGLTFTAGGLLSGTPTEEFNHWITITCDDEAGNPGSTAIYDRPWLVNPSNAPINITTTDLPDGTDGVAYSQQLQATGGNGSFTWTLDSGALPSGVTLSSGGLLSGTPDTVEAVSFTVSCTDGVLAADTQAFSFDIVSAATPTTITTMTIPSAVDGQAFSFQLQATGGDGDYDWTVISGSLPSGITLSSSGLLSGTHTGTGSFLFTVQADDEAGSLDTQGLFMEVVSTGVWVYEDWDYADQATMHGQSHLENAGGAGGLGASQPTVLASNGPWGGNTALQNYFGVIPADWQPQVATNLWLPTATETEIWIETHIRFGPNWTMAPRNPKYNNTPPDYIDANGNVDHKTLFIFEEGYTQRWEIKFGPNYFYSSSGPGAGGDAVASAASHSVSYGKMQWPASHPTYPSSDLQCDRDVWDDAWHNVRIHAKMGVGTGRMQVWFDGYKVIDFNNLDTNSGSRKFMLITFGGNRNQGTDVEQSFYYGPASVYRADPGW